MASVTGRRDAAQEWRWIAPLFIALVVLHLVPVWAALFIPTADGPSHLYNSWVIKELVAGDAGILERVYRVDWRPHPNWTGHAIMAALMFVVEPVVAEKILFSLIIVLFLGGAWMLCDAADRRCRPYAFLAFPFAYHQLLQTGFYNFSLSLGLHLVIMAAWWKRRDQPTVRNIALIALLIVLCYFSHPMSAVLAIGSVGLLWLFTARSDNIKTHWRHLIAFVPVVPLLVWFLRQRTTEAVVEPWTAMQLFVYLFQAEILVTFTTLTLTYAKGLFVLYVVLIIATLIRDFRRRDENAFGIVTLATLVLYIFSPDAYAGGQLVRERLSLYLFLAPLPWFSPRLPKRVRNAIVVIFSIVAIVKGVFTIERYRHFSAEVTEYVRSYAMVKPEHTVIPLLFTRDTPGAFTGVIGHAVGYAAIERRLVDVSNYEPRTGYFPIAYHPDYKPPGIYWIEATPAQLDVPAYAPYGDYVVTWKMPHDAPVVAALEKQYRVVDVRGFAVVYERKAPASFQTGERLEQILLPIGGTSRRAPDSPWKVTQTMRNTGTSPIRVVLSACPDTGVCELDVGPGETVPLAVAETDAPYIVVTVRESDASRLAFATSVASVSIPAVRSAEFRPQRITINGVKWGEPGSRVGLRLWTRGTAGAAEVRIRAGGSEHRTLTDAGGFFIHGDLGSLLPGASGPLEIEVAGEAGSLWGFATTTRNGTVTLHLP